MTTDTGLTAPTHPVKTSLPPGIDNSPPPSPG